jgi:enoyl-[acyl-carrier-protein] reductase (NADH)
MKTGTIKQITDTVLFLLANDYITGQVIYVDGGRHLKGNVFGL